MKKYHYTKEGNQFGPISIEELKDEKITKETMVWYEGLDDWVKAGEVEELKSLFKSVPPPLNIKKQTPPPLKDNNEKIDKKIVNDIKPKKKKTGVIIISLLAIALISFFVFNYSQSSTNNSYSTSSNHGNTYNPPKQKTEKELKKELGNKECNNPTKYLKEKDISLKGVYKNALSFKFNAFKVKFKVYNSATVMTFKNIKCKVTLSSNSGSTILTKKFTVSEFVKAGSYVSYNGEFACTNQQFKDTDVYSIDIIGAECH